MAVSALLPLWCVLALAGGEARALCLDLGGECSPTAAFPEGPCHDQMPDGAGPECGSCIDIVVLKDASAVAGRAARELPAPASSPCQGSDPGERSGESARSFPSPSPRCARPPQAAILVLRT